MLTKRNDFMAFTTPSVKKARRAIIGAFVLCMTATAPNAFAGAAWYEKTVSVKVSLSDLRTETGVAKTYAKLEKRAKSVCRSSVSALHYSGETVDECVADLMEQFVESVNVESLKTYHLSMGAPKAETFALNAK